MRKPKVRIYQNVWGNWNGYIGTRKVMEFGPHKGTADEWYLDQVSPRQTYGLAHHPTTGEPARPGTMWVRNLLSGQWFLENDRTPYSLSAASETYWQT